MLPNISHLMKWEDRGMIICCTQTFIRCLFVARMNKFGHVFNYLTPLMSQSLKLLLFARFGFLLVFT